MTTPTFLQLVELGRKNKQVIAQWRLACVRAQIEAPHFIHEINACTSPEELSDEDLGKVCQRGTAERLKEMGYSGARSNSGETISPVFTVCLNRTEDRFGNQMIFKSAVDTDSTWGHRGFYNRTDIREFFCAEVNNLLLKLLRDPTAAG